MNQKKRNSIAIKIAKLFKEEKTNIFDCLNILQNLEDSFIRELEYNINSTEESERP